MKDEKPPTEFEKFDKVMDKIMSVTKEELDRRLKAAKIAKKGKRYPKHFGAKEEWVLPHIW
jgi:hypothetical protein